MHTANHAPLGFGLMRLPKVGEEIDVAQTSQMVDAFLAAGFTYFDTAYVYTGSEDAIRKALVERHPRDSYTLATKLNARVAKTEEKAKQELEESLARTGAGYFDYYLLHAIQDSNVQYYNDWNLWDFVKEQKARGLIRHYGFSFHGTPALLDKLLTQHPDVDFVQLQINYADWDNPEVTSGENYRVARAHGKQIVIMEPVKGGALADPPQDVKDLFDQVRPGMSYASWALRFAASLDGILVKLAGMGYTSVEAANYNDGKFYGRTPEEFKAAVEKAGMTVLSSHVGRELSQEELASGNCEESLKWWDETIAAHKAAGMKYVVMPWMGVPKTLKDMQTYCDYFNEIGRRCQAAGMKFGYHNHNHEFQKVEDKEVMYDYMLQHTDPSLVFFEMDVYWVVRGQSSPVAYFKKYPGRFRLLHIKDELEIGQSGMVGFDAIFRNVKTAGTEGIVVEVERYSMPVIESVEQSIDYLLEAPFVPATYAN